MPVTTRGQLKKMRDELKKEKQKATEEVPSSEAFSDEFLQKGPLGISEFFTCCLALSLEKEKEAAKNRVQELEKEIKKCE